MTEDVEIIEKTEKLNISTRVMNLQEASSSFKEELKKRESKVEDIPVFCFFKKDQRWHIGEKGKERDFDDLKGFEFIHVLLCNENKDLLPLVIYNGGKISGEQGSDDQVSREDKDSLGTHTEANIYEGTIYLKTSS